MQSFINFNALENQLGQNEDSSGSSIPLNFGEMMRRINDATKSISMDEAASSIVLSAMGTVVAWKDECCVAQNTQQHIAFNDRIRFVQNICKLVVIKAQRESKHGKILIKWVTFTSFLSAFLRFDASH